MNRIDATDAGHLYEESLRLRHIADLLLRKSELLSMSGFMPDEIAANRIAELDADLGKLGWPLSMSPKDFSDSPSQNLD